MFIIKLVRNLLSLYALVLIVDFALQFVTDVQKPWMAALHRICEPGIKAGNRVMDKLFPQRRTDLELGGVAAVALCLILRVILSFFL